jgi:hypothetical protein
MTTPTSPDDVLVLATVHHVTGYHVEDGTMLWEHGGPDWYARGVPLVVAMGDGVVAIVSGKRLAWLRILDGHILGQDEIWFNIDRVVRHGRTLVVHGDGLACYRDNVRVWGLAGVKKDPGAFLSDVLPFRTDAHGHPVAPAGSYTVGEAAALVLGTSATQIDRTVR